MRSSSGVHLQIVLIRAVFAGSWNDSGEGDPTSATFGAAQQTWKPLRTETGTLGAADKKLVPRKKWPRANISYTREWMRDLASGSYSVTSRLYTVELAEANSPQWSFCGCCSVVFRR
ncbi:hypothetical protein DFJ77DRAFT_454634 [Powellomyces hirtus]|nr:hypothetical protein DFJ77DRAFT_454634 [Powellomyces hirtus]